MEDSSVNFVNMIIFIIVGGIFTAYYAGHLGYSRVKWFIASAFGGFFAIIYILAELPNRMLEKKRRKEMAILKWKLEHRKIASKSSETKVSEDSIGDDETIRSIESVIPKLSNRPLAEIVPDMEYFEDTDNFKTNGLSIPDDEKFSKWHYVQIIILTIIGMISVLRFRWDFGSINLMVIQIFIVFLMGYHFGKKVGLITGFLIFLPNFIFYIAKYAIEGSQLSLGEKIFGGYYSIGDFSIRTFSLITYALHSVLGFLSGMLRKAIPQLASRYDFISLKTKTSPDGIFFTLILLLISAFSFRIEPVSISLSVFFKSALLLISFFYGFHTALKILLFALPIAIVRFSLAEISDFGIDFGLIDFFWYLSALLFIGFIDPQYRRTDVKTHPVIFSVIFFILLIISLSLTFNINNLLEYYSFRACYFIFPILLICGYLFGPRKGFMFGIILGLFTFISIKLTKNIGFGNMGFLYETAPIIGYIGGTGYFRKPVFLKNGLIFAAIFYSLTFLARLYYGNTYLGTYLYPFVYMLQTTISMLIFYPIFVKTNMNKWGSSSRLNDSRDNTITSKPCVISVQTDPLSKISKGLIYSCFLIIGIILCVCVTFAVKMGMKKQVKSDVGKGAVYGTAGGAAAGALAGQLIGRNTKSTLIGAAVGSAIGGAAIQEMMDKQESAFRQVLAESQSMSIRYEPDYTQPSTGGQQQPQLIVLTLKGDEFFKTDSEVNPGAYADIDRTAQVMREYSQTTIIVEGHTDSTGNRSNNQLLSERRSQSVANLLMKRGVDASRITTVGYGQDRPVASNNDAGGHQLNRRVEIRIKPMAKQ